MWSTSVAVLVVLKAVEPNVKKRHMIKNFLGHQKEKKKKSLWQHDSWFIDFPVQFFHPGCFERAKQSLSLLAVMFPWQMDTFCKHTHTHKHTGEQAHAQTHRAPSGWSFLILKYTAINQTPLPRAPARLSQWKAQASGTLIAIYRASHARSGTSTERPLFWSSLFLSLTTCPLNWLS